MEHHTNSEGHQAWLKGVHLAKEDAIELQLSVRVIIMLYNNYIVIGYSSDFSQPLQ